jgi:8-oxo-dGTP diphosphatase
MMSGICKVITGVALVLKKADKILLYRRNIPHKIAFGSFALPGGTVENDETVKQAACREAAEELGISINEKDITIVHVLRLREKYDSATQATQQILFLYFAEINVWIGEPQNLEPHKHSDLTWFARDNLPKNLFPLNEQALGNIENGVFYAEHGW